MNAAIDGIDAFSVNPVERLQFFVYMERLRIEALKTQALLLAQLNPQKAPEAAKAYLDAVLPISADALVREKFRNEMKGQAVGRIGAFGSESVRIARPGSAAWQRAEERTGGPIDLGQDQPRGSFVCKK